MPGPRISVVVPFYNNVDLLGECLASIAAQTHADLQVVMVDDGSTDGSGQVAAARAAADGRFTLIRVPNGGPGSARNRGVAAADGEYLAFVDADDLLPPDAYATMLAVLQQTGSDFVSGAVTRFSAAGHAESGLHDRAIKARRLSTHISRTPDLCYDISVWNKLFRRSFWDAAGLAFPEGMLWEDLVAMTTAHVLASAVDVITEPVYLWRDRDKGAPSITQSRTDISNFGDRITALEMIDAFLTGRSTPGMVRQHQHKALVNDLWLYVTDLHKTSGEYLHQFTRLARRYLAQVDRRLLASLPTRHKLAYHLIAADKPAELAEYSRWLAAHPGRTPPMVRTLRGLRADLPFRRDRELAVPDSVYRPRWRELDPHVRVDQISWHDGRLVISGYGYIPSVDIGRASRTAKLVVLVPRGRRRPPIVVPATSVRQPEVTERSGQDRYSYDWAGFRCEINPRWFRVGRRWLTGTWDCYLLVRARGRWRPARLHTPGEDAARPAPAQVAAGLMFGAQWAGRRLQIRLGRRRPAGRPVVTGWRWQDARLVLSGELPAAGPGGWEVVICLAGGWEQHTVPAQREANRFSAAVPLLADVFGDLLPLRDGRWDILFRPVQGQQAAGAGEAESTQLITPGCAVARGTASRVRIGHKVYRCEPGAAGRTGRRGGPGGGLRLTVAPALRPAESGRIRRRLLRDGYYRAQRALGRTDAIVFVSFKGKQAADSPRAIADELRRRGDTRDHIWAVADWSVPVPDGAKAVLIGGQAYYQALARSRYLVANDHMPPAYRKRAGQRYVQTWHGTPLKRIGYDIGEPKFASGGRYYEYLARDVSQWDLLISPNPFSTPIMRKAFRYEGEICESGYPRNDTLAAIGQGSGRGLGGERAAKARRLLGLPDDRKVAMYVPTWRDGQFDASGRYRLDFRLDMEAASRALAADYVLLIRGHHLMASGIPAIGGTGFARDVTSYRDIADLLLVTDVLITDYSSVMFDFAPAARPMLFFVYDLDEYRDKLRGFYFDFEAVAPGPLLRTSDQLICALAGIDAVAAEYRKAHEEFAARFCPLDDGKAAARACDAIFGA